MWPKIFAAVVLVGHGFHSHLTVGQTISVPSSGLSDFPFDRAIDLLPLQHPRVAWFPSDRSTTADESDELFFERAEGSDGRKGIRQTWRDGALDFEVDAGRGGGWRMKLREPDWERYSSGSMAIRLRAVERPLRQFTIELRSTATLGAPKLTFRFSLGDADLALLRQRGFGDVLVPLSKLTGDGSLRSARELALDFEQDAERTDPGENQPRQVSLHSIRLIPPAESAPRKSPDALLDDLALRALNWFERNRHSVTGLIPDRASNWENVGLIRQTKSPCSIASVGYYLSLLPDAVATRRLTEAQARERAVTVLRFIEARLEHHAGFFRHFIDMETGERALNSEISVLDSSIFFNGGMVASIFFRGEVEAISNRLLARVNWGEFQWRGTDGEVPLLAMAWNAQRGVHGPMNVRSSEFAMACFLAVGAERNSIAPSLWLNTSIRRAVVGGHEILNPSHGLFTAYYGLGWHSLEGRPDPGGVDLWANARSATLANRALCRADSAATYQIRWGGWWGISAGDSPRGYIAPGLVPNDAGGTVWPTTALAALPWAAPEIEQDLAAWAGSAPWDYVLGPYGLAPFHLGEAWIGQDLIGIDLGSFYLAGANHRRGTIWNLWKQHPIARRALEKIYGNAAFQLP